MDLILDAGNSTLGWALFDPKQLKLPNCSQDRLSLTTHLPAPLAFGHRNWEDMDIETLAHDIVGHCSHIHRMTIASVRPEAEQTVRAIADSIPSSFKSVLDFATLKPVVKYAYPAPETVGIDRWANSAALAAWGPLPAVAIDLGSATTVSVVDGDGNFTGGWIAPGLDARIRGLGAKAPHLPLPPAQLPPPQTIPLIGNTSAEATAAGLYRGYVGEILYYLHELEKLKPALQNIVLTGGFSEVVYSYIGHSGLLTASDKIVSLPGLTRAGIALLGRMVQP